MKARNNLDWATMLKELEAFEEACGHLRVEEQRKRYPALAAWFTGVRRQLAALTYEQILGLDRLGFFDRLDQHWLDRYAQLKAFHEKTGHCKVTRRRPGNPRLFTWAGSQRRKEVRKAMAPWRRRLLNDLGFPFKIVHTGVSVDWDEVLGRLARFRERFGHCNVLYGWREDKLLSNQVIRLRSIKKMLDPAIIKRLDALGFDWDPLHTRWEKRFRELEAFKQHHGHCRVTSRPSALANWIGNLRRIKGALSKERIRRLDALGFDWAPIENYWDARYRELLAFKRGFRHTRVPARWPENRELATWVVVQRSRKEALSREQIAMLDKVGFEWDPEGTDWMLQYEKLKAFQRKHGHCNLPVSRSELGRWVHHQRQKDRHMTPERAKLLDAIGFNWKGKFHNAWMQQYEEIEAWLARYDHYPSSETTALGKWVNNQRTAHRKQKMPAERTKLLEKIGFVWRVLPRR